ncbi:uncharacterized protein LOC127791679 [Diospyros lotus]|uniref:uncharacterized protein LOC127791679 n=1 Tax=Diospyros lotus TaxID=55363 RepID=UPI00224D0C95|nr:uncharacterized protein LOC127791679 [Diospyros lotus]
MPPWGYYGVPPTFYPPDVVPPSGQYVGGTSHMPDRHSPYTFMPTPQGLNSSSASAQHSEPIPTDPKTYFWQADENDRIWLTWNKSGRRSFRSHLHRIRNGEDEAMWMDPDVRKALDAKWAEESNKKIATQNKKNRASETGGSLHTGGSIPFSLTRRRLATELNREPNEFEFFRRTHTRKDNQGEEVWVDDRSRAIAEKYERLSAEASSSSTSTGESSSPTVNEHDIFYQAVSGRNRKGRIYGLGSQANLLYPSTTNRSSQSSSHMSPEFQQMKLKVTQLTDELLESRAENRQLRQWQEQVTAWQSEMNIVISRLTKQSTADAGPSTVPGGSDPVADQDESDNHEDENANNNDD